MQDVERIRQTLSGNTEVFGGLVEKYRGFVYGLCFHLIGSFPDAEDLAQEAFLRAYTNLHRLNDPRCFAAWLKRIVSNTCLDWGRRRGAKGIRLDPEAMELPANSPTPEEAWEEAQRRDAVQVLLARIPESSRLTLTLRYIDDLSCEEIARFLKVPLHTVKNRLRKGRAQLREEMIRMVADEFERNRLGPAFDEKVMRELIGRGRAHIEDGETGKAIEELERARKIDPTNARAFRLLMQATASQQDVEEASHERREELSPPEGVTLLDIRDISRRLEVSPVTIYRWIQQGLPCYRLPKGALIRFDLNAVKRWLDEKGIRPEPKIPMLDASQTVKCILKGLADQEINLDEAYDMVLKFGYAEYEAHLASGGESVHLEEIARLFHGEAKQEMLTACARYEEIAGAYRQLRLDFSRCENYEVSEVRRCVAAHLKGIVAKERDIVSALDRAIRAIEAA